MNVNVIPERLIAFKGYHDGTNDLIGIADVDLPAFDNMTETVKGAGIAGEYESATLGHFQKMTLKMKWNTLTTNQVKLMRQQAHRLDFRGAQQIYDSGTGQYSVQKIRVVAQGTSVKTEPGKLETSKGMGGASEIDLTYIKIEMDGTTVVEIDKLNYICVIDGVDYLAAVRDALGM